MSNTLENICEDTVCSKHDSMKRSGRSISLNEQLHMEPDYGSGLWKYSVSQQNLWTCVSSPWGMAPFIPFDCNVGCVRF